MLGRDDALKEARILLTYLVNFMDRHGVLVPEITITTKTAEVKLSMKLLPPTSPRAA
jgi:hypothetical protein